jgi:hypothetical protein
MRPYALAMSVRTSAARNRREEEERQRNGQRGIGRRSRRGGAHHFLHMSPENEKKLLMRFLMRSGGEHDFVGSALRHRK